MVLGALAAHGPLAIPEVPNNTPTRWMEHQRRQAACLRTTRCRTSYGFPNPAAGAVCGTMTGCVRHCRRYDHYRGTVGDTSSSYEEICAYGLQYRHKPNLCGEWRHRHNDASCGRISTPHAQSVWSVWRGQQPATVLRSGVHHADGLIPAAGAVCGAMTGCVRHCRRDHAHGGAAGSS